MNNILIVVIIAIAAGLLYYYYSKQKDEGFCRTADAKFKTFRITKDGKQYDANYFRYKSWDGVDYFARLTDDNMFYITNKKSGLTAVTNTINILRFRSMQWIVSAYGNYFQLLRLGGTLGINTVKIDAIDWDDRSYTLQII